MNKIKREILIKDKGEIVLARVLTWFDIPLNTYPGVGVWSYFINTPDGIVLFDTGTKYKSYLPVNRSRSAETENVSIIMNTLEEVFPKKTIREIYLSHYHFDHSEIAPEIQMKVKKKFGNIPPIRIHGNDLNRKTMMRVFDDSLGKIFFNAGYRDWVIGEPLEDADNVEGTDFNVLHTPGHTDGNISLVNNKYKVIICGWWIDDKLYKINRMSGWLLDEDKKSMRETIRKARQMNYKQYLYHPIIRVPF